MRPMKGNFAQNTNNQSNSETGRPERAEGSERPAQEDHAGPRPLPEGVTLVKVDSETEVSSYDASAEDTLFHFESGEYTYQISGFDSGDKLHFDKDTTLTLVNDDSTDGIIEIQAVDADNNITTVQLTDLTTEQDSAITDLAGLAELFNFSAMGKRGADGTGEKGGEGMRPLPEDVTLLEVDSDGSYDASTDDLFFAVQAGDYSYEISGFDSGDHLHLFRHADVTIDNSSEDVVVSAVDSEGNTTVITLTGIEDYASITDLGALNSL